MGSNGVLYWRVPRGVQNLLEYPLCRHTKVAEVTYRTISGGEFNIFRHTKIITIFRHNG